MNKQEKPLYIGQTPLQTRKKEVSGGYIHRHGEPWYRISHYMLMPPFFMTLVSSTDQWLFIGSNGGITAGRKNPDSALFPYYTVDKILETASLTGSKTILKVQQGGRVQLWEPFSRRYAGVYRTENHLYKNRTGSTVLFEEINLDLQLTYSYQWCMSPRYGFVKVASLHSTAEKPVQVELLDGVQNLLPYGLDQSLQNNLSNLADAYKKSELSASGLGIFSLSSMVVDKAEPSEALMATTVWMAGLPIGKRLLSSQQLDHYRRGYEISNETDKKAAKGAFFADSMITLEPGSTKTWYTVADLNQGPADVANLDQALENPDELVALVQADIAAGQKTIEQLVSLADGEQTTGDALTTGRHFSNVLFNIMRGGVFSEAYRIAKEEFLRSLAHINPRLRQKEQAFLEALPEHIHYPELVQKANQLGKPQLYRAIAEYLPLIFSRRHGDPSRPWNYYHIDPFNPDGTPRYQYEGNWRDIFQNWEALAYAFPHFVEGMIARFLNASTVDGYNPYRINHRGIDWEVIDPEDPWSYIGYWGDHQIIYLLKLLEHAHAHFPQLLAESLNRSVYVYAQVPYRIKGFYDMVQNAQDTIIYDEDLAASIANREVRLGAEAKLVLDQNEEALRGTLTDKLLVTLLARFSNFIPEGGIWLNTQRPEWNDANNALVGNGVSMVTLYYLRRFICFFQQLLEKQDSDIIVREAIAQHLQATVKIFQEYQSCFESGFDDEQRYQMVEQLGLAGEKYRREAYAGFHDTYHTLHPRDLLRDLQLFLEAIEATIDRNKRPDGLYHSYNIMTIKDGAVRLSGLYEMLEGQVSALSAGHTSAQEAVHILDALKQSDMYRADQYSYMLYPNRELPTFLKKNLLHPTMVRKSALAQELIAQKDFRLVEPDQRGDYHFHGRMHNARDLEKVLNELAAEGYRSLVEMEREQWLQHFEKVFNHRAFTGRSGTFFSFEGLGCIYWHMVSKLLLAVQEHLRKPELKKQDPQNFGRLVEHYYEIKAGIGINKSPDLYGAFPTDAYSHTPAHGGAKQPGMTGQVKEDILNRWAELGITISEGGIVIQPLFLRRSEFLQEPGTLRYYSNAQQWEELAVTKDSLAFTYCGTPVVYRKCEGKMTIGLQSTKGETITLDGAVIPAEISSDLFLRRGRWKQITVKIPAEELL